MKTNLSGLKKLRFKRLINCLQKYDTIIKFMAENGARAKNFGYQFSLYIKPINQTLDPVIDCLQYNKLYIRDWEWLEEDPTILRLYISKDMNLSCELYEEEVAELLGHGDEINREETSEVC